jgi:aspartyl protease family protein
VKVGGIEPMNVEGTVLEEGLGAVGLLGMSFLNRVEMQRDGQSMTLIRRF